MTEKDDKKRHNGDDLEWIYQEVFGDAVQYMKDFDVQAMAATYMAIAMRLYKTHLDEEAYKKMIETVVDTEVEPYCDRTSVKKFLH